MEYRPLGRTGLKVSQLCFGTMSFSNEADEETSLQLYRRCRDAGINFFDTADVYGLDGGSELILGKAIQGHRDEVVITSKVYFPNGEGVNARGAHRKHILKSIEGTLDRLDTDYLDIYFIHRFDEQTPLELTLRTLEDLVRSGMILFPAVSNFAAWQVEKALGIQTLRSWSRLEVLQPMYNLLKRQAEVEILPMALVEEIGVIPYSPLGGGLLSGKYGRGKMPDSGRLVNSEKYKVRYGDEWIPSAVDRYLDFAEQHGYHPASLAVAWAGAHPAVTAPIIGARNLAQLEDSLRSVEIDLTPELYAELSALTPTPPLPTDRAEEPFNL